MIQITGVSHSYDGLRQAVDNLSLSIKQGEIFALVGPNGAGKSTTLRMLATLLCPSTGTITIDGYDTVRHEDEVRRRIGYLPDHFSLYDDLTPVQLLEFFGRCHGLPPAAIRQRTGELLEQLDLTGKRHTPTSGLSRGMKQRLGIAKTLIHQPRVVLLDEPASGLDPLARHKLREMLLALKKQGTTLLISSHILSELGGLSTSVGIVEQGRLLRSGPLSDFVDEGFQAAQRFRLRLLGSSDKIDAVLRKAEVPYARCGGREVEVEVDGEERLADLIEQLVLRGVRVSAAAPVESQLEAIYRAAAHGEVA